MCSWDRRERAARAEVLVTPGSAVAPQRWLFTLALGVDGGWRVSGLQREGFEG